MKRILCLGLVCIMFLLGGCGSDKMKDGFYTAEMSDFSRGWKEYLCIMVKNDTIVYGEFNAKDPSGYIKAWDNNYMENMETEVGTYPNEYTRTYVARLINKQNSENIDVVSGATTSGNNFKRLAEAVIQQAKEGDSSIAVVQAEAE